MPNAQKAINSKKFLDINGLAYFAQKLNQYPTNDVIEAVVEGVQDALDEKVDIEKIGVANGVASLDSEGKIPVSQIPGSITDTTYTLSQDATDGHKITLTPSSGSATTITIPDNNTTYSAATTSANGLMSSADKRKLDNIAEGATANIGTITGITMNGVSKGASGVVNLGTVITAHQDISGKLNASLKGAANGLAELDENGKVPSTQLPSYVDDVLEFSKRENFPLSGETGKIYVNLADNKTYRWGGSEYVEISSSLALGTTSSTAFRGDYGNTAYSHATAKGSAYVSGLYKITTNSEGHVTNATAVGKSDITSLGIPGSDTTYAFDGTYNASTNKAATVSTVTNAINALDGGTIGEGGAGKTITALSQTNGNVSATFSDISITKSQVSDLGTIGTAASKGVDSTIAAASTSTNLPTSKAVAAFVEGKGYKTTDNNTTYTITQDRTDGHKFTLSGSDGSSTTITIPDNNTTYTLASLGIGNVKNYDQSKAIKSITRSGNTFTYTCLDDTTGTFTQKDDNTWIAFAGASASADGTAGYVPAPGKGNQSKFFRGDGTWATPTNTNTTYTLTQDSTDGHKFTLSGSDGTSTTITIPDNDHTYSLSSLGIGNVKNYDQSKAIKSITRSGTTFTYTCLDNTTGTFTQQDNNTWTAFVGASSTADGTAGYVPAPGKGNQGKFFRGDGTWAVPTNTNTTYSIAQDTTDGHKFTLSGSDGSSTTITIPDNNTTYSSKEAASGGTDVSLVTTGEKAAWNAKTSNTGTVTSVATGVGLTGGTITGTGTIKAKLKTETAATYDSASASNTSGRQYPVVQDKSGYLSVNVPWTDSKPVTSVAGKTGAVTLAKSDVGLGNVENKSSATIRGEITSSNVTTALGFTPMNASLKGANSGVAELDENGKVPSSQLPSFVDDVLEYDKQSSFPTTGETGKIYIAQDTNKTYRWSGTAYAEISASLALGETSSTAYRGDRGKTAYDHASAKGSAFSKGLYKITTNAQGHVTAATAVAKADITALGIPGSDTNTTYTLSQDATDGHKITLTPSSGTAMTITIPDNNTTYSSKAAASGGTDVSLVTTGEKATWNAKTSNTGTVTSVATGVGLTGGTITGSGTIKAKLKSETASTLDSASMGNTASRQYAVGIDKSGYLSVNVPWTDNNTNTTYSLTQDSSDGHKITLTPSSGSAQTITIPDNNTWRPVSDSVSSTSSSDAASSKAVKTAYDLAASKTSNTGTVTSVATGVGLTGGTITTSGTIKANLKSETLATNDSATPTNTGSRQYAVTPDKSGYLSVNVPWTDTNTDTKVTAVGNHYTPATDSNAALSASASGATAAWGIDVVKGVSISRDAKGHVTGISVTSGKIPGNPNTDTKNTAGSTDSSKKLFIIGAESQAANPQTYSQDTAYIGTDGCLYSGGVKVLTSHQDISGKMNANLKGVANGVAELGSDGKVPSSQLPSFVDDVLEYEATGNFPTTGETGKIYVATSTNKTYRWSGTVYVEISASLALGETSATAYRGDRGKAAYDHAAAKGSAFSEGLYKITTNEQGHVTAATAVAKADITALGIPGSDTNTHRPIQVNGTEVLGNNTTALNLKAGSNVSVTNSSGTVTISATNTTYSSKAAASGGTDLSLVTTGEKATWNAKTSNTGTVTSVATGVGLTGGTITGSGTIKAKLKSETASTLDSASMGSTANRQYAVGVDKSGYLSVNVPWVDTNTQTITGVKGNAETSYRTGNVNITPANIGASASNHTHTTSIATSTGTNQITLAASTKYVITAGGTSYVFTTPPNTTYESISSSEIDALFT